MADPHLNPADTQRQTQWSLILQAGSEDENSRQALERLCQIYWQPVFAYIRHSGYRDDEARDLTQEFFVHVVESDFFSKPDRERGRFRSYLKASVGNFLKMDLRDRQRLKRGGKSKVISFSQFDESQVIEPLSQDSPEKAYQRHWAKTVIDRVFAKMEADYRRLGKAEIFKVAQSLLLGETPGLTRKMVAQKLGSSENQIHQLIKRMKIKFRNTLRSEVTQTIENQSDIDEEVATLLESLEISS